MQQARSRHDAAFPSYEACKIRHGTLHFYVQIKRSRPGVSPISSALRSRQQAQTSWKLSVHLHEKNWASWDNGDGNGERSSCDGASPALKRCLQLVVLVLCFICYRIWAQRVARRQSFPESPSLWKSVKGDMKYSPKYVKQLWVLHPKLRCNL